MDRKMYIPKTVKVGYQNREGTYTGKLAYIIYVDDKGKVRKEASWQSWRDHKIKPEDFDNEPTSGFVLNKKAGGVSWSHWHRNTYVRVYDPRNFEFEISIPNLLFILQECSSIKGKGLEGEFVYAWSGTELVLLPVDCEEYKECVKHTARQKVKFDKKDIKEGYTYIMKDGSEVLYLGRHSYNNEGRYKTFNPVGKKHIFKPFQKPKYSWEPEYLAESGFTKVAECTSEGAAPNFADEYEKFKKSSYCADVQKVNVHKVSFSDKIVGCVLLMKKKDEYYRAAINRRFGYGYGTEYFVQKSTTPFVPEIKKGTVQLPPLSDGAVKYSEDRLNSTDFYTISVVTEKGKSIRVGR